jgi:hypothetical protein
VEHGQRPSMPTIEQTLACAAEITMWLDVGFKHGAQGNPSKEHGVKRRLILYNLPYFTVSIVL